MDQTSLLDSNDEQGMVYQYCKFYDQQGSGLCVKHDHICHIVKCIISLTISFSTPGHTLGKLSL